MAYKNPLELANKIIEDQDVPTDSNEERLKEGGLAGRFTRAGHKVSDVTDDSLVVDDVYKVVANKNLGFDVFDGEEKVANDIGNQRNFIALLDRLNARKKYAGKNIEELDKLGFNGPHNNVVQALRNSAYDSPEAAHKAAKRWNLDDNAKEYLNAYINAVFGGK